MENPIIPELLTPESLDKTIVEDAGYGIEEQEDGSVLVDFGEEDDEAFESAEFGSNLAEILDEHDLQRLGADIAELVESDRTSRAARDKQYAEGIRRTGLGNDAPGGATFDGASRAVHPMLAKGCIDFASRAIKELFPASGPCKTQIIGESNDVKIDKAERKKSYMNWQLTTRVAEQRAEFERLLSQLPLGGSQYKRWWWDPVLERPRTETVYVDDVFLPYSQSDFYTSYRVTHRQWVSCDEYDARIASGLYRDLDLSSPVVGFSDRSNSEKATDKVEGNDEDTAYNDEGQREIYQIYVDLDLEGEEGEGRSAPYILHIENTTQRVLGLYRNWAEDDDNYTKKHWMVEYNFIPWRGAYGVGLYHLIGSLAASGTGALRALLDSAQISNFPGGLKLKGGRTAGQSIQINATELAEIDAPAGVDDIRKLVMPFPFAGPSPVLFSLLEWLTNQAEGVISTASEKIADAGANMPVGTALALIEHGSVNFSAIHARCHASLKRELEILHRLDAENMTDEETVEELGELVVTREDFQGPMDIIPVSDPNIFSEAQRYAQLQAVMQLADNPSFKQFFKGDRLLQRALRLLQISSPEDLANLPKDPKRLGALDENYLVCSEEPGPIKVYQEQDDVAHLEVHLNFLVSPMFGANPLIGVMAFGPMMGHIKDHLMNFYRKHTQGAADAMEMMGPAMGQPITRAQAEAKGAAFADQMMANLLGPMIMPAMQQAQKLAQQFAPKPPMDPAVQAQIAGQQANTTLQIQGTQALEQMRLQDSAKEADKERALKFGMKQLEVDFKKHELEVETDQNDRSTVMATAVANQTLEMQNQLAQFTADSQTMRERFAEEAAMARQQQKEQADAQMLVLQTMLSEQPAAIQPQDVIGIVQPMIQEMQANTQQMLGQLQTGMSALHEDRLFPRLVNYLRSGKKS